LPFNGLHGVLSQETEPFINTAGRTSTHMRKIKEIKWAKEKVKHEHV
jgi:hypothetical protein